MQVCLDSLESFVDGPEPTHIRARGKEDKPQYRHSKISGPAPTTHPCQTANQIHRQGSTIY